MGLAIDSDNIGVYKACIKDADRSNLFFLIW